jgi:3',5'-cyclic AMP phosphodiesterase CpdA
MLRALAVAVVLTGALAVAGCARGPAPAASGAPLSGPHAPTWADPDGNAVLTRDGRPEPLRDRTELGPPAAPVRELASFAQITDAHVEDEESPAQIKVLDRLGEPFEAAFRPQETLSSQVLAEAVRAVNRARPQAVVVTGDLIDSAQRNELDLALAVLRGGRAWPDSGRPGYEGPQEGSNPDPLFYRPDVDAPHMPGLLSRAQRPFRSEGLRAPWYPVVGNHDVLVEGVAPPSEAVRRVAVGDRALVEFDRDLTLPQGDSNVTAEVVDNLLEEGLPGRTRDVAPDSTRRPMQPWEVLLSLRQASDHGPRGPLLDYAFDVGAGVRGVVLDTARREGGASGLVRRSQRRWLQGELSRARRGGRWVVVFSHHDLSTANGGRAALRLLDVQPRVLAAVFGHSHRHSIRPRRATGGGYWLVGTASLVEHPQQARMFRVVETAGGRAALETWTLDHPGGEGTLSGAARQLAYLDSQGGRPGRSAGGRLDRNVRLFR